MELEIHPLLYSGVRDTESGELGSNWYPQTAALPTVDHVRFPHTYPLGLILPIRWGWDWKKGRDFTRIGGGELLRLAGIPYVMRRAAVAWAKLRKNLAELERIGGIGRIEWEGEPWSLSAIAMLYPPQWARERTVHQLRPVELKVETFDVPMTGAELIAWRNREGLTHVAAAARLGVGVRTVERAESSPERPVGKALRRALSRNTSAKESKDAGTSHQNPPKTGPPARTRQNRGDPRQMNPPKSRGPSANRTRQNRGDPPPEPAKTAGTPRQNPPKPRGPPARHLRIYNIFRILIGGIGAS